MNNIINKIKEEAIKEACKLDLEIIDVEWVNEFGTNILRIIADSKESLNIDQATALNEAMSLKLDELDLSDKETATEIGNLLDTTKNSQVLGEATKEIASKVLEEAYKGIEGHEAPEITDSINYAEEFAKLQELLKK